MTGDYHAAIGRAPTLTLHSFDGVVLVQVPFGVSARPSAA
jgi:hypothetical protein